MLNVKKKRPKFSDDGIAEDTILIQNAIKVNTYYAILDRQISELEKIQQSIRLPIYFKMSIMLI